jgi:uncharacterized coiled-coil protein SlyX
MQTKIKILCLAAIIILCFGAGYYTFYRQSRSGSESDKSTISKLNQQLKASQDGLAKAKADNTKLVGQIKQSQQSNGAAISTATETAGLIQQGAGENQSAIETTDGLSKLIGASRSDCSGSDGINSQITGSIDGCLAILETVGKGNPLVKN